MIAAILPDGRELTAHDWGDPSGRAVLVVPGAGMAGALPFGETAARRLGLRLVSVDRPGLGGSTPHPAKSFASWSEDIGTFLATLGLVSAPVVGFSQGAPFALALASAGRASMVAIVSGQDELTHPAVNPLLPPPVAGFVGHIGADPVAAEAEIATSASAGWLWQMIETMSGPSDRAFYASAAFAPAYRAALAAGFARGAAGYARDTVLALSPWPFRVDDVGVPARLWYGLEDTSPVHSPDFGRTLAGRLRDCRRREIPGAGSAILWTHADAILEDLAGSI
jgi:pimeloyl-ACP methyl ester carboxylesterase